MLLLVRVYTYVCGERGANALVVAVAAALVVNVMDKLKDNVVQIQQKVDEINTAVEVRANSHTN